VLQINHIIKVMAIADYSYLMTKKKPGNDYYTDIVDLLNINLMMCAQEIAAATGYKSKTISKILRDMKEKNIVAIAIIRRGAKYYRMVRK